MGRVEVEIELDEATQLVIDERMETGKYGSPSEVVEEALARMMASSGCGSELPVPEHILGLDLRFWLDQVERKRKTLKITRDGNVVAMMKPSSRENELKARIERLELALELRASGSASMTPEPGELPTKRGRNKRRRK
ncbi:MAG: hypothetical protein JWN04_4620 [Myxococcaceae bacterium]|nr:hypothetical protein [Myxococcaceae bacterium]